MMNFDKLSELKHFVVRNEQFNQMVMSAGHYFGNNIYLDDNFENYLNIYGSMYEHLLAINSQKKEKLHVELNDNFSCGYYDEAGIALMVIGSSVCDMEEMKVILGSLFKMIKDEENNLFLQKYW